MPTNKNKEASKKDNNHHVFSLIHHKKKLPESFDVGKFDYVNLKAGSIKFKSLYGKGSLWKRYLIAIIIGIVMGAATQFLVKNTGLYNSGLSAITQGIARISNTLSQKSDNPAIQANATIIFNALFWGIYVLFNVPLFIFALKKIGKTFANLTIVFIVVTNLLGFGLSCIHNIDHVFLFGNSIAEGSKVDEPFSKSDNIFAAKGIYNIPFWFEPKVDSAVLPDQIFNPSYDPYKALLLFIYAFAYGLICSVTYAILYIVGGCSGGGDFLSIYYSSIKHRPLGSLLIAVNSSMLFFGFIIGSYLSCGIMNSQGFAFPFFFSANLIASFLSVVVFGLLLNKFFPIQRIVKVEIISERIMGIRDELFKSNFTHSMTISKNVGAYTLKEKDIIWTVCMYIEVPNLVRHIKKIDDRALVIVSTVNDVDGQMKIYRQGSID